MHSTVDNSCSLALVALLALALTGFALAGDLRFPGEELDVRQNGLARARARRLLVWSLSPLVRLLVSLAVPASAVTAVSLALSGAAGLALAVGHFGLAALLIAVASLGDAVDGLVARRTMTASPAGALFDASADRYEEFFILGGIAVFVRAEAWLLVLTLLALAGSFMVSYGSAKAEAYGVEVPGGLLRRAERAGCLAFATTLVPLTSWLADRPRVSAWLADALGEGHAEAALRWLALSPVVLVLALFALLANASAASRLAWVAEAARGGGSRARTPGRRANVTSLSAEEAEPHPAE